eukprot:3188177-Alexandrium_andersonii.AAC.1
MDHRSMVGRAVQPKLGQFVARAVVAGRPRGHLPTGHRAIGNAGGHFCSRGPAHRTPLRSRRG